MILGFLILVVMNITINILGHEGKKYEKDGLIKTNGVCRDFRKNGIPG